MFTVLLLYVSIIFWREVNINIRKIIKDLVYATLVNVQNYESY